jgi:hypothetical protein
MGLYSRVGTLEGVWTNLFSILISGFSHNGTYKLSFSYSCNAELLRRVKVAVKDGEI